MQPKADQKWSAMPANAAEEHIIVPTQVFPLEELCPGDTKARQWFASRLGYGTWGTASLIPLKIQGKRPNEEDAKMT